MDIKKDQTMGEQREMIYLDELLLKIRENREIGEIMGNAMTEVAKSCKTVQKENLVELPYPPGTKEIYYMDEDGEIYTLDAEEIQIQKMIMSERILYTIDNFEFFIEDFGKIVFLTKKEAENASRIRVLDLWRKARNQNEKDVI